MKFLSTFAYTADVLPKGSRKQRREVLYAKTELEIADLSPSDMATDAVVVQEALARPGEQAARRYAFAGYDGRLWSAVAINTYTGKPKSDAAHFLKSCEVPWPAGPRSDNPLSDAYDENWGPQNTGGMGRDAVILSNTEENYAGRILDVSQRPAAIERCHAIARDIVNVDGTIHVRRPEPVWEVSPPVSEAVLAGKPRQRSLLHRFRLDRLDVAREWSRRCCQGTFRASGEIVHYDPAYLQRDDLSHFLTSHLRPILDRTSDFLPYLDPSRVASWHRLAQVKDQLRDGRDGPFPLPLDEALNDVRWLCGGLAGLRVPASYLGIHDTFVRDKLDPFLARLEFELARRPAPSADDVALARLGTP